MAKRYQLVEKAQELFGVVIELLEIACKRDGHAKTYLIDHLKIRLNDNHLFLSTAMNLSDLLEKYEGEIEDVGGDDLLDEIAEGL